MSCPCGGRLIANRTIMLAGWVHAYYYGGDDDHAYGIPGALIGSIAGKPHQTEEGELQKLLQYTSCDHHKKSTSSGRE